MTGGISRVKAGREWGGPWPRRGGLGRGGCYFTRVDGSVFFYRGAAVMIQRQILQIFQRERANPPATVPGAEQTQVAQGAVDRILAVDRAALRQIHGLPFQPGTESVRRDGFLGFHCWSVPAKSGNNIVSRRRWDGAVHRPSRQ